MAISSKIYKRCRAVSAFLAVLIAAAICGQSVFAGGLSGTIQLNCSIEQDGSVIDLSGDTYAVVQIAAAKEIHSDVIEYQTCEAFSQFDCDWNSLADREKREKANVLQKHAEQQNMLTDKKVTDSNGMVQFSSLTPGLYLVVRTACAEKNRMFITDPFLVSVPTIVNKEPAYLITASPKFELDQTAPSPDTGDSSGMQHVFVFLLMIGTVLCTSVMSKKRQKAQ